MSPTGFDGTAISDSALRTDRMAASSRRRRGRRTVQPHRRFEDSQPRPDLRLRSQDATGEPACARQITENLARRAFRRPVTADDVNRLMPFYEAGRENGGTFDQGIEQIVAAVLASPEFLYRRFADLRARSTPSCSHRSGTGLAAFLLPVEHRPGRGTVDARRVEWVDPTRRCWRNR